MDRDKYCVPRIRYYGNNEIRGNAINFVNLAQDNVFAQANFWGVWDRKIMKI